MPPWRISILSIFLVALPYPFVVSAQDAPGSVALAGNPLIGTWRHNDTRWSGGAAEVTFVTFRGDGSYQVRLYNARLPGPARGVQLIAGRYDIVGPGRFVFRPQETFSCPTTTNCVPSAPMALEPQTITFRFEGSDRMIDGEGTIWRRVR